MFDYIGNLETLQMEFADITPEILQNMTPENHRCIPRHNDFDNQFELLNSYTCKHRLIWRKHL